MHLRLAHVNPLPRHIRIAPQSSSISGATEGLINGLVNVGIYLFAAKDLRSPLHISGSLPACCFEILNPAALPTAGVRTRLTEVGAADNIQCQEIVCVRRDQSARNFRQTGSLTSYNKI